VAQWQPNAGGQSNSNAPDTMTSGPRNLRPGHTVFAPFSLQHLSHWLARKRAKFHSPRRAHFPASLRAKNHFLSNGPTSFPLPLPLSISISLSLSLLVPVPVPLSRPFPLAVAADTLTPTRSDTLEGQLGGKWASHFARPQLAHVLRHTRRP